MSKYPELLKRSITLANEIIDCTQIELNEGCQASWDECPYCGADSYHYYAKDYLHKNVDISELDHDEDCPYKMAKQLISDFEED